MMPVANRWLLVATVALLPLLIPRGPGESAPVDVVAVTYILVALAGLARPGRALRLPAMGPFALIAAASLAATSASLDLPGSMLALFVELYLFLLFACVANDLGDDQRGVRTILVTWSVATLLWAAVFVGFHFQLLPSWLHEPLASSAGGGPRVAGAAKNPNLAASYLMTSFFVLLASAWPRRWPIRLVAAGWLLLALYLTGSNGALLGLAAGVVVVAGALCVRWGRTPVQRLGMAGAVLLAGGLVLGAVTMTAISRPGVTDVRALAQRERGGVFDDSLGRLDRSVNSRLAIWSDAWGAAGPRLVVGVGPAAASEIPLAVGTLRRGLHNDYLAFLIERGVLGLLGLLTLTAVLLAWSSRLLVGDPPDGRAGWLRPAWLGGAVAANLVLATNHESFHFRHVWVLLGLVWAATQLVASRPATAGGIQPDPTVKEVAYAGR
jgi:O-antigen ligase